MPYEIKHDVENCSGYAVVLQTTGKIVGCHSTKSDAIKHLAALQINVVDAETKKLFFSGGAQSFTVEYSVPDCQDGWAVMKDGTGQVVGCHKTEEDAKLHAESLTTELTDILGQEIRTTKNPNEYMDKAYDAKSFWDGAFAPTGQLTLGPNFILENENGRFYSPMNTPPQKDGEPSAGYGNQSGYGYSNS